ncbi:MAG: (2Fe-2S)-binding protein [Pseudonocardia sp.]
MQIDARGALAVAAELGPFFAVATGPSHGAEDTDRAAATEHSDGAAAEGTEGTASATSTEAGTEEPESAESSTEGAGFRPVRELYTDAEPLDARLTHVRAVLGCDSRTAASITFQGLAARVLSAPLAAAILCDTVPLLTPDVLRFRVTEDRPWPLWCADPVALAVPDPADAARALADLVFAPHLAPLVAAVRARVPVSARLLWGNVASSVAAGKRLTVAHRPDIAERAATIAGHLLRTGPLAGAGTLLPPRPPDRVWTFRRRSCCLYYRVPGGGLCGDCGLDAIPGRA